MTADIRAAVLVSIDRLAGQVKCEVPGVYGPAICPCLGCQFRKSLRLLREDTERHVACCDGSFQPPHIITCSYCRATWPCPAITTRAQVYAPDALREKPDGD